MVLLNPYHDLFEILQGQSDELRLALRKKLIWAYSWAVPNTEAILAIASLGPLVELGAGTGYWSWLLRQAGADVVALDHEPAQPPHWTRIEKGDETSLSSYEGRSLLLCWPPYQDSMAFRAAQAFQGDSLAYVGERNGRTADESFHQLVEERFALVRVTEIPSWPGYHDRLEIYRRRVQ